MVDNLIGAELPGAAGVRGPSSGDDVGYTSTFAFSIAFKRRFDMAPGQYRRAGPDR